MVSNGMTADHGQAVRSGRASYPSPLWPAAPLPKGRTMQTSPIDCQTPILMLWPEPPEEQLLSALNALPGIFASIPAFTDHERRLAAGTVSSALRDEGHSDAAADWAVLRAFR